MSTEAKKPGQVIRASLHGESNGDVGGAIREILGDEIKAHGDVAATKAKYQAKHDRVLAAWKSLADCYETRDPDAIAAANKAINSAQDDLYGFEVTGDPLFDELKRAEFYRELDEQFQEGIENGEWVFGDPTTPEGREQDFKIRCSLLLRRSLDILIPDGQTFEIRAIFGPNEAKSRICHSIDEGMDAAKEFENAKGIYFTLNPLRPDLKSAAKDGDVTTRRLLLIDIDAVRSEKGELSTTNAEKKAAIELAAVVGEWLLVHRGWPRPIIIDSGNGIHLLFWIDLPNDDASKDLVRAVLVRLAKRFNTDRAKVDTTVHNAARISKLPYTRVRKGPNTAERPHRMAMVIDVPDSMQYLTSYQLEALVEDFDAFVTNEVEAKPQLSNGKASSFTRTVKSGSSVATMTREEYGKAELEKEITQFGATRHPGRHEDLLRASMSLAGLVLAKALTEDEAINGLYAGARSNGMEGEGRLGEVGIAWKSAMEKADARIMPHHVVEPASNVPGRQGAASGSAVTRSGRVQSARWEFSNCDNVVRSKGGASYDPRSVVDMADYLNTKTGGWPKRVDETLFLETKNFEPVYLESSTQLFGHLRAMADVLWLPGPDLAPQEQFYEYLRKFSAEKFKAIERFPHFPAMPDTYYMHPKLEKTRKKVCFRLLMDFFGFDSEIDRSLGEAAVLTLLWGGSPGARPCFLIRGPEDDVPALMGRYVGKTTFVEVTSELVGGLVDLDEKDDMAAVKTRLLSNDGMGKRVLRIDNVKTIRMGWAEFESFITSDVISGRRLYKGEGSRPNTITPFITMNGGSLSKDMATRAVPIRLKRPTQKASWRLDVSNYIREHRWEIIAEIEGMLSDDVGSIVPRGRWAEWQRDVLGKVKGYDKCQEAIEARCQELDADDEAAQSFEAVIAERLSDRQHKPQEQFIRIPPADMGIWYSQVHKAHVAAKTATERMNLMPLKRLKHCRTKAERFWLWSGENATGDPFKDSVDLKPDYGTKTTTGVKWGE